MGQVVWCECVNVDFDVTIGMVLAVVVGVVVDVRVAWRK